eukprot:m.384285 g.384285  ORF g.384285 m.384285 type:complete len:188 (-) comp56269_c0_seq10:1696-2259(-)
MGQSISAIGSLFGGLFQGTRNARILMLGLDAAGKTTILYKLHLGEVVHTIPTIGFNVESVSYKNVNFTMWDVGGQTKIRPLWRHYYNNTEALIFVVDSSDSQRFAEAREELAFLTESDELRNATLLVFANKSDMPGAVGVDKLADHLGLRKMTGRNWFIQPTCATTGDGLYEGLDWLTTELKKPRVH